MIKIKSQKELFPNYGPVGLVHLQGRRIINDEGQDIFLQRLNGKFRIVDAHNGVIITEAASGRKADVQAAWDYALRRTVQEYGDADINKWTAYLKAEREPKVPA